MEIALFAICFGLHTDWAQTSLGGGAANLSYFDLQDTHVEVPKEKHVKIFEIA